MMTQQLIPGNEVWIQSFKHDGSLHRTWCKAFVLEETEERYTVMTNKAWVIEHDGRRWFTREPAVYFLWKHKWFNVIAMIRKTGVYYYCNLASPSIYDGEAIKNIDYDLDVKLYPDRTYEILDENEYAAHAASMQYGDRIKHAVEHQMQDLLDLMEDEKDPFNQACIDHYYGMYLDLNVGEE
ncbi:MAG: DUF402 domain-containing protein [Bulleidia sp.]|nr:DUF402 domain-containing protein [Bulleidia sp.]